MGKLYDVALVCERLKTSHVEHELLVDTNLSLVDRVLVLLGSAQESGTEKNPFDKHYIHEN